MNQSLEYLNKLMYHITSHLDMSGNHRYTLRASAWPVITEIKAWLASQQDTPETNKTAAGELRS